VGDQRFEDFDRDITPDELRMLSEDYKRSVGLRWGMEDV